MTTVIDGTIGIDKVKDGSIGQADLGPNVAGNGPAFSARATSGLTGILANSPIKVPLSVEDFDLGGYFDSVTNYRFTPLVAGYYQFDVIVRMSGTGTNTGAGSLRKNGVDLVTTQSISDSATYSEFSFSALIYLNGSTDYIELWAANNTAGAVYGTTGAHSCLLSGFLARAA